MSPRIQTKFRRLHTQTRKDCRTSYKTILQRRKKKQNTWALHRSLADVLCAPLRALLAALLQVDARHSPSAHVNLGLRQPALIYVTHDMSLCSGLEAGDIDARLLPAGDSITNLSTSDAEGSEPGTDAHASRAASESACWHAQGKERQRAQRRNDGHDGTTEATLAAPNQSAVQSQPVTAEVFTLSTEDALPSLPDDANPGNALTNAADPGLSAATARTTQAETQPAQQTSEEASAYRLRKRRPQVCIAAATAINRCQCDRCSAQKQTVPRSRRKQLRCACNRRNALAIAVCRWYGVRAKRVIVTKHHFELSLAKAGFDDCCNIRLCIAAMQNTQLLLQEASMSAQLTKAARGADSAKQRYSMPHVPASPALAVIDRLNATGEAQAAISARPDVTAAAQTVRDAIVKMMTSRQNSSLLVTGPQGSGKSLVRALPDIAPLQQMCGLSYSVMSLAGLHQSWRRVRAH